MLSIRRSQHTQNNLGAWRSGWVWAAAAMVDRESPVAPGAFSTAGTLQGIGRALVQARARALTCLPSQEGRLSPARYRAEPAAMSVAAGDIAATASVAASPARQHS